MAAYVVADVEVTDSAGFHEYKTAVLPVVNAYGGEFLARGGSIEPLEGGWAPTRLTILKFDSVAQAKEWYESQEYRPLRELRQKTTKTKILIVEGL
jgi:uncharacterized protein (DUF1330 family)